MSKTARLLSPRPLILSSSSTQSLCRRSTFDSLVRPTRQRLLYTTRPLCATIVTSATAFSPSITATHAGDLKAISGNGVGLELGVGTSASEKTVLGMERLGKARAEVLRVPSKEDIEEAELDVEVLAPEDCTVLVTERAAEVRQRPSSSNL